jgi:hypothetical protein
MFIQIDTRGPYSIRKLPYGRKMEGQNFNPDLKKNLMRIYSIKSISARNAQVTNELISNHILLFELPRQARDFDSI